ncbi:hypothetical protein TNIN_368841 [Trichonephila inaurata madagascariensis]|uniref:Uncharacterized protein n=1 Tax=Trichonephila inaurata madagascariensis TaxID=2747483 RepID=A0A8X7C708_9ARAC|nr:hypothetical protein TNIN_368841 [Trichonephila inaurata madagascariensis]
MIISSLFLKRHLNRQLFLRSRFFHQDQSANRTRNGGAMCGKARTNRSWARVFDTDNGNCSPAKYFSLHLIETINQVSSVSLDFQSLMLQMITTYLQSDWWGKKWDFLAAEFRETNVH